MQWIDELAGIVSMRHAGGRITTASIDNLNFKAGAYLNDTIVLIGRITYVGRTSMEVRVESESEKAEWEAGQKRYALRKQRRREGF